MVCDGVCDGVSFPTWWGKREGERGTLMLTISMGDVVAPRAGTYVDAVANFGLVESPAPEARCGCSILADLDNADALHGAATNHLLVLLCRR